MNEQFEPKITMTLSTSESNMDDKKAQISIENLQNLERFHGELGIADALLSMYKKLTE